VTGVAVNDRIVAVVGYRRYFTHLFFLSYRYIFYHEDPIKGEKVVVTESYLAEVRAIILMLFPLMTSGW